MLWLTQCDSTYLYLEQITIVPKIFEPLKFDYTPQNVARCTSNIGKQSY